MFSAGIGEILVAALLVAEPGRDIAVQVELQLEEYAPRAPLELCSSAFAMLLWVPLDALLADEQIAWRAVRRTTRFDVRLLFRQQGG